MVRFIVRKSKFFNFKRNSSLFRLLRNSVSRISDEYQNCNLLKDEGLKYGVWAKEAKDLKSNAVEYQVVVYLQEGRLVHKKPCLCRLLNYKKLDI